MWLVNEPVVSESLATSAPKLSANFSAIESVLGSSTLSTGIAKVQGDTLYASDGETLQRLAKATPSSLLTNWGATNNPSWVPTSSLTGLINIPALKSAANLEVIGTVKVGVWSGTAIATGKGGTGFTIVNAGATGALTDSSPKTTTFTTAFSNTNYYIAIGPKSSGSTNLDVRITAKTAADFTVEARNGSADDCDYIALGN